MGAMVVEEVESWRDKALSLVGTGAPSRAVIERRGRMEDSLASCGMSDVVDDDDSED